MTVAHELLIFNISLSPAPAQVTTLGTIALLAPDVPGMSLGDYTAFTSYDDVVAAGVTGQALTAAAAAFSQPRKPTLIIVNVDVTGSTQTQLAAYTAFRAQGVKHFAVATTSRVPADQLALSAYVETINFRVGLFVQTDEDATGGWPAALAAIEDNVHTSVVFCSTDTQAHELAALANRLTFNWDATSPSFRGSLSGVTAEASLTQPELAAVKANALNVVAPFGTAGAYFADGVNAENRPVDEVFAVYWFVDRLEAQLQKIILQRDAFGQKIPIDSTGQAIMESAVRAVYEVGVNAGHFKQDQMEIVFPSDLSTDLTNKTLSATVNITQTRGAKGFSLNLNFSVDDVLAA